MLRRISAACAAVILVGLGVAGPVAAEGIGRGPTSAPTPGTARLLLYGDSLTMGTNADWTWRYRLWQSLDEAGAGFDFVGPRKDVAEYTTGVLGNQGYRQPAFDTDHAALAGMQLRTGYQVSALVRMYRPTVVVGLIGLNDLTAGAGAPELEQHWRQEIAASRAAARGVDFVLVQLPQAWWGGVPAYNDALRRIAAELDTADERVLVSERADLDFWADTYDYAHLSAAGERKVASVVLRSLARLGIGSGELATTPDPEDDHRWAPVANASVDGTWISLRWNAVTYASSQDVWARDLASGEKAMLRYVEGTGRSFQGEAGHTYELWLEPVKGYLPIGTRSAAVTVSLPAP